MDVESVISFLKNIGLFSMLASGISALLASKSKNVFVQLVMDFVALLALNIGKAKNADDDR